MILNIAFYKFVELAPPEGAAAFLTGFRSELLRACGARGLLGTILLSPEGVNGVLAGETDAIRSFQEWIRRHPGLSDLAFKESRSVEAPFGKMLVKIKKEIIPLGLPGVRPSRRTGKRLSPRELREWLDEGRDIAIVDTRNDYELAVGTFEGAIDLGLKRFREFPWKLDRLSDELRAKPVVMFCTGGIRCEKATALAIERGFGEVYQLEGGILRYFEECGRAHYRGDCFVFDDRIALEGDLTEAGMLQCVRCRSPFRIEAGACASCA